MSLPCATLHSLNVCACECADDCKTCSLYDLAAFFSGKRHQCSQVGSSMSRREMLEWSQARQKDIQDAYNDTPSWTALDEIVQQHNYSFSSIAAWPVDGCLVCKPTERASVLLGSLQAACNLDVIKEDLGVSVTVVVSMCETEMKPHGAPSNWKDYFSEHDVVHIHCQLDDITLKQPGRDLDGTKHCKGNASPAGKAYASNCGNSQSLPSTKTSPCTFCFIALVGSIAALRFCVLGLLWPMTTPRRMRSSCCSQRGHLFAHGAIETMFWMHCGWWNNSVLSGARISNMAQPSSHLLADCEPW